MYQFSSGVKKQIAIFLLVNIFLQSCVVYQKTSVPLESAVDKGKAKLITTNGERFILRNIEKEDSVYYCQAIYETWYDNMPISPASVDSIYLKDKKKSTLLSWLIPLSVVVGLFSIFLLVVPIDYGMI
jgi:hypothetical protein